MGAGKILLGLIFLIIGLWLIIPVSWCPPSLYCQGLWAELWIVIKGVLPISLIILGFLMMWVESEELKYEKPAKMKR